MKTVRRIEFISLFLFIIVLGCICSDAKGQVAFSTYFGGTSHEWIKDMCVDQEGNVYVTGPAYSTYFPITQGTLTTQHSGGASDVFVAKFNSNGELIFSTLLGGSDYDGGEQIALDKDGNIIVVGVTASTDFPATENAYDKTYNGDTDIFITKINSACDSILYSTYLGGNNQDIHPVIALDETGCIYISGPTRSPNFPTTDNAYDKSYNNTIDDGYYGDIFICKFDQNYDSLLYSSFVGGSNEETVFGIDVDKNGTVYLTGFTISEDFPNTHQLFGEDYNGDLSTSNNVYLIAMDCSSPSIKFSTILGGSGDEQADEIFVDQKGNIFIAGNTASENFPVTQNAFSKNFSGGDIFVCKLDTSGKKLIFSTYVGGTADEGWCDLAVGNDGNILVGGGTSSSDFPITSESIDSTFNNGDEQFVYRDAFFFVLNSAGTELIYSTFLGGTGDDNIFKLKVNIDGSVYIGGLTTSDDFPITPNCYDNTYNNQRDAFLLRLDYSLPTSIEDYEGNNPLEFNLNQNYPNPFNSSTRITYDLIQSTKVELRIYDVLGRYVRTLENGIHNAGTYTVTWDGDD
ncbi:MAG: SBBP repeat-containing protein [Ignavibacteria bacterium]|jgi:hypothetical protein